MHTFRALQDKSTLPGRRSAFLLPETAKELQAVAENNYGEYMAEFRGALLRLFGEPYTTEGDAEYTYVIEATDAKRNQWVFSVSQGASGPYIGGDVRDTSAYPVAQALRELIESTLPMDFDAVVHNVDTDLQVTYGCRNGIGYWREE